LDYINLSICWFHLATNGCHPDSPQLFLWVKKLAVAYAQRYLYQKNLGDLEQAHKYDKAALELISEGLGQFYCAHFKRLGNVEDLNEGIDVLHGAVKRSPEGHHDPPEAWRCLSILYVHRFKSEGNKKDIEGAISLRNLAVQKTSLGTSEHIICTQLLGAAHGEHYKFSSSFEDLELSIKYFQQAIHEAPPKEPIYAALLEDLGIALMYKYKAIGGEENLFSTQNFWTLCHLAVKKCHNHKEI